MFRSKRYSGFDPRTLGNCALWLDAADTRTLTLSGSNVTAWADKSGSNVTVSNTTRYPVYASNQIGGLPGIQFSGSNELQGSYTYATQTTMFVVYTTTKVTGFARLIDINSNAYGNFGTPWNDPPSVSNADALLWLGGSNYPTQALYTTLTPQTGSRVYSVVYNGTSSLVWRNGTSQTLAGSGFAGTANGTLIGIGGLIGRTPLTDGFVGSLGEVILFKSNLTTSQRQQVEGYLAWKWGLTSNLPSSHPFRLAPPVLRPFVPTDIANCALWLDAADPRTLTLSGSNVTAWADKSGNGRDATVSSNAFAITSNSGLFFNNSYYTTAYSASPANETFFCVFTMPSALVASSNGLIGTQTGGRTILVPGHGVSSNSFGMNNSGVSAGAAVTGIVANTRYIGVIQIAGTSTYASLNGNSLSSPVTITAFTAGRTTTLGRETTTTQAFNGFVHELVAFTASLSTADRQQVEAYLATKWGLQGNTPSTHPARISPGLSPQFMPTLLSNCALWLDAADAKTITLSASNTVTAIRDKSSNSYSLTGASGFTYATAGFNGRPCFFNSTSNAGVNLGSNTSFNISTPLTIFFAGSKLTGNDAYIVDGYLNGVNRVATMYISGGYYVLGSANINVTTTWAGSNLIVASTLNGASSTGHVNGTLAVSGTTGATTSFGGIIVGARFNVTQPWDGNFCELVIYSGALSTTDRQQVEGYLATKWGLQGSLPASHPYKTTTLL